MPLYDFDFQVAQPVKTVAKHMEAFLRASLSSLEPDLVTSARDLGLNVVTIQAAAVDARTFTTRVEATEAYDEPQVTVTTFTLAANDKGTTVSVDTAINGGPPEVERREVLAVVVARAQGAAQLAAGLTEFIATAEAEGPGIE